MTTKIYGSAQTKLLLVDDADETCTLVRAALRQNASLHVTSAHSIAQARAALASDQFEMILLDLSLPDGDGLTLFGEIKQMKKYRETPIIILTSSDDPRTRVAAFTLDVDDFVGKPFNLAEFRARVESKLRRHQAHEGPTEDFTAGSFVFELATHRLYNREVEKYVDLTSREFKILLQLARHPLWIFSRNQIIQAVWPAGVHVTERAIDTHICLIRRKLGNYSDVVESVLGEGYRFRTGPPSFG